MATCRKKRKMEDALTCSICTDVFRQPVTLPCQHSYCRECLLSFSKTQKKPADTAVASTSATSGTPNVWDVTPTHTNDTPTQVDVTPIQTNVTPIQTNVTPIQTNVTPTQTNVTPTQTNVTPTQTNVTPTQTNVAPTQTNVTPIQTNVTPIQTNVTPIQTNVTPIQTNVTPTQTNATPSQTDVFISCPLCQKPASLGHGGVADLPTNFTLSEILEISALQLQAGKHTEDTEALSIYCVTCDDVVCNGCLIQHDEHSFSDISIAYRKRKVPFLERVKNFDKLKGAVEDHQQKIQTLMDDIKAQESCYLAEIQRAYDLALESLQTWRMNAEKTVQDRYQKYQDLFDALLKKLQLKLGEMESLQITAKTLMSGEEKGFLQKAKEVSERLDHQLKEIEGVVNKDKDLVVEFDKFLIDDAVPLSYLSFKEKTLKRPMLKFRVPALNKARIKEDGLVVELEEELPRKKMQNLICGRFIGGQYYWEVEVATKLGKLMSDRVECIIGIASTDTNATRACVNTWWGIAALFYKQKLVYKILRDEPHGGLISEGYKGWNHYSGHHSLGIYVDLDNGLMNIIDCSQKQIVFTVNSIDISKPLSPFIGFACPDDLNPTVGVLARLITRDNETLHQILHEVWKNQTVV